MLSIKADFDAAYRMLSDIGRQQLAFATAMALNDTAKDVQAEEEREMDRAFVSPTPFTKRALYLRRASKRRLTATVGVKKVQAEYLKLQVSGGRRQPKGRALVVPVGARLNKYGNLPKGALGRLKSKGDVFIAGRGQTGTRHLPPGVYRRTGRGRSKSLKLLIAFEPKADYAARWTFGETARDKARRVFPAHLARQLRAALRTAR